MTTTITRARWSNAELTRLKNLYPNYSNEDIACRLGRTRTAITAMAVRLRLKKSEKYLSKMGAANISVRWG